MEQMRINRFLKIQMKDSHIGKSTTDFLAQKNTKMYAEMDQITTSFFVLRTGP